MTSCGWNAIRAWVIAHQADLPTSLDELVAYPMAFRRVIINAVSPEQRTRMWQAHLRTFLLPAAGLDEPQRRFVEDAADNLPATFGAPTPEEGRARMQQLEAGVREVFTLEQGTLIFGTIGPPEPAEGVAPPADFEQGLV